MGGPKQILWNITANKENVAVFFQLEYAEFSGTCSLVLFRIAV